ncbi:MAG: tyrosine-type recombinase/integrase [Planctomycetota bacterium]|jgi:integrase
MRKAWIYQRPHRAGWWVGWFEAGRKKAKHFPNKTLAEHFAKIKYSQLNKDVFTGRVKVAWALLRREYIRSKKVAGLEPVSIYDIENTLNQFEALIGPVSSKHLTQAVVDAFIVERAALVASRHTLNKDIRNLKGFLLWGQHQKRRYFAADLELRQVKAALSPVRPLTGNQVAELLLAARAEDDRWFIRVLLALSTGLRKNDVEKLSIADIDFEHNSLDTKSKKTRKSMLNRPLPADVVTELANYVAALPAGQRRLFSDTHTFKKWKRIRTRASLPELRYQDLRVTFSSALQAAGQPIAVAQRLLEHSRPEITDKWYTNVDSALRGAVESLPVEKWLNP